MTTTEIKAELLNGNQFENARSGWYTISRPTENFFMIVIGEENKFYKNLDSYAKRISQLMKKGF